jgi:hypothetical protein
MCISFNTHWEVGLFLFIPDPRYQDKKCESSRSVVRPFLEKNFERISKGPDPLKDKATLVIAGCESELAKQGTVTVGGLFQGILLSSGHIYPLTYGVVDLNPEHPGEAKETSIARGTWTHKDLTKGKEVSLVEPAIVLGFAPRDDRFHDYKLPPVEEKSLRWYLRYFLTCLRVDKTVTETKLHGVLAEVGAYYYPRTLPVLVALSFWGPHGRYPLQLGIEDGAGKRVLHQEDIDIGSPYEGVELERLLMLEITEPGPAFLECHIGDFLLARRSLYFGRLEARESPPAISVSAIRQELVDAHRRCADRAMGTRPCFLDYFVVCQNATLDESEYTFVGEPKGIYSAKYPLHLQLTICTAFRFSYGKHLAKVELVNAFTHTAQVLASGTFEGSSDCTVAPVQGMRVVSIPEPGIWYFNLTVDDTFIGSVVLPAETDSPKYSYSLRDEDVNRIRSGEVLMLMRRAEQTD